MSYDFYCILGGENVETIFKQIGVDSHDESSPVVSDGNKFFVLDSLGDGSYGTCTEVLDKDGSCKNNDSNTKAFKALYKKQFNTQIYSLYGYIIF